MTWQEIIMWLVVAGIGLVMSINILRLAGLIPGGDHRADPAEINRMLRSIHGEPDDENPQRTVDEIVIGQIPAGHIITGFGPGGEILHEPGLTPEERAFLGGDQWTPAQLSEIAAGPDLAAGEYNIRLDFASSPDTTTIYELTINHPAHQDLRDAFEAFIEAAVEEIGEPPDRNCSCHLKPPCGDCENHSFWREALAEARAALKKGAA